MKIYSAIACNLDQNTLETALPLFAEEQIEAIEWSFDTLFKHKDIPDWFVGLLEEFAQAGRLVGHGVFFSLFSGQWRAEQTEWLEKLAKRAKHFQFQHITEHFGFMTGADFHKGAPMSIPFSKRVLEIGQDRLKRIQAACECPVGLENLAFAYSLSEVEKHGQFLDELVAPANGFIILDLHNLYCQIHNFGVDADTLLRAYPLHRVREIHISGGSWSEIADAPNQKIRRDTHDESCPEAVFELLQKAIPLCPNLRFVVLEQMGFALVTEAEKTAFRSDFLRMRAIVEKTDTGGWQQADFAPILPILCPDKPIEDKLLYEQQTQLTDILETAENAQVAAQKLALSALKNTDWAVENWDSRMLETALAIAQKWKKGW
jgi:uncharacterized protein